MANALLEARSEAVFEIQAALFKASGDALMRHGDDPHSEAILAAAIAMYIGRIDELLRPGFRRRLIELLSRPSRSVGCPLTPEGKGNA
jgi:hypothetical protein